MNYIYNNIKMSNDTTMVSMLRHELEEYGGVPRTRVFDSDGNALTDGVGTDAKITDFNTSAKLKKGELTSAITMQNDINDILINEKRRLDSKEQKINNAYKGQMHVLQLNESYRKRNAAYTPLLMLMVFAFTVIVIMRLVQYYLNIIPDSLSTIVYILLFSSIVIFSMVTAVNVYSRDNMNFDKLDLAPPKMPTAEEIEKARADAAKAGNLLGLNNSTVCTGASCCAPESTYDLSGNVCVLN